MTYTFQLTTKDNLGNVSADTIKCVAYDKQTIIINPKATKVTSQIK